MKTSLKRLLVFVAMVAAGALPVAAAVPPEVIQNIECSQPVPEPPSGQPAFSCEDNRGLDHIDLSSSDHAYRYRWTGQGVHVYVLDTGIHVTGNEEEFGGRVEEDHTEHSDSGHLNYNDCSTNGHGTRVASVIGGSRYGVAKDVTLHLVKYGYGCNVWNILGFVSALEFIRDDIAGARDLDFNYLAVVNISTNIPKLWHLGNFDNTRMCPTDSGEQVLCITRVAQLVDQIIGLEVPVVVSAGNYDNANDWTPSSFTPSDVPGAFVIGGVDRSNARWRMSGTDPDYELLCTGTPGMPPPAHPQCGSNFGPEIDLWAPAEFIWGATNPDTDQSLAKSFGVLSGTSFAAPHVTGAIALYMEEHKAQNGGRPTVAEVKSFLLGNAVRDALTGNLVLNTYFRPRPADDVASTPRDTQLSILYSSLLANDQGTGLEVVLSGFSDPLHGTITVCCNPAGFKYTPDPGYVGPDSFTYTVEDDDGVRGTATVNVTVVAGPIANDDSFTTTGGTQLGILYSSLLANDQGTGLEVVLSGFSDPPHGSIQICCNPAGFKYTPDPGYIGLDSFTYTVEDDFGLRDTAVVHITVENRGPVAVNDSVATERNTPVTIAILANDSDPDGHPLTITMVGCGAAINSDQTITYTPPSGFVGSSSCPYTISDGQGAFASATFTVTVRLNHPPVANPEAFSTPQNTPLNFTCEQLLVNDSDPDNDPLTVLSVGQPSSGTIICTSCNCRYTPVSGFVGLASFVYTVGDGRGGTGSATDTITVFNRQPVVLNDTASTPRNLPVTIYVLANDSDPDGNPLTVQSVTQPLNGSVVIQPGGGAVTYTPGSVGNASFRYVASDGKGGTAQADVSVTILQPNTPPDARGDQLAVPRGLITTIPYGALLANDFDADGQALTIASFNTAGLVGAISCPAGGTSCTYTPPNSAYTGVTTYTYTISDGAGSADTATVKLKVGLTQSRPVAVDDLLTTARSAAHAFTIFDVLANDSDADGDVLSVQIGSGPRDYGSMSCTLPNYNCTYTPNAGFVGIDRFAYTVSDGADGSASAFLKMVVLPPATPVLDAREDQTSTSQNMQIYIGYGLLRSNDYDPEGDPLTITSVDSTGLNGSLQCDPGGCLFRPSSYFAGITKFRYTVSDGRGNSDTAIVRIKVGVPNDAPVAANDALTTKKNTTLRFSIFDLMKNDHDPQNDPINVIVYPNAGRGTVSCGNPQYWCTYTPNANVTGTDTFTYVLSDGIAYSASATVNVTVTP